MESQELIDIKERLSRMENIMPSIDDSSILVNWKWFNVSIVSVNAQLTELNKRIAALEAAYLSKPLPRQRPDCMLGLSSHRCVSCNRTYGPVYAVFCGAMPRCPHCGKNQSWWESKE